jgi:hypothetical protein
VARPLVNSHYLIAKAVDEGYLYLLFTAYVFSS